MSKSNKLMMFRMRTRGNGPEGLILKTAKKNYKYITTEYH